MSIFFWFVYPSQHTDSEIEVIGFVVIDFRFSEQWSDEMEIRRSVMSAFANVVFSYSEIFVYETL